MPRRIFKCTSCGRYTLNRTRCPACRSEVKSAHPPRWSPTDKYAHYRVQAKIELKLQEPRSEKSSENAGKIDK
ncbi:MAG: ribosome biogenesis protein [Crenarchaeota archaeon]|nr:ribosome biogenesis protein [Thermoproteota archaeon]MCR8470256.1 ribosome biogenesis protein [Thermoproteota archaeon]MCR8472179.1 ribosome biogenesis protein [Thermoproteota archaeon]MCR8488729.1 ribosome biogenesis protein [Thermoproteota archaeon]